MRRWVALAGAVVLTAGCGGSGAAVADCYSGAGTTPDGQRLQATLRLALVGGQVTGTYVAGPTAGQGLAYDVRGTVDGGRFAGTFTAAGQAVAATGTVDAERVVLDGGRGFSVTEFRAGC